MHRIAILGLLFFFALSSIAHAQIDLTACREKIAKTICVVDPVNSKTPGENYLNRPCLAGSEKYQSVFEAHFDRSNPLIAKMYCHLEKILVENSFFGTAFAGMVMDANKKEIGGVLGIRKELLDNPLDLQTWLSWKEETTFGGSPIMTAPRLNLIQYLATPNSPEMALDYVLNHEFGHLFDYANNIVQVQDCRWVEDDQGERQEGTCVATPGTWNALSWKDVILPLPEHDYALRAKTCFYMCEGVFLSPMDAVELFNGLMTTNFVSTYAATNMHDDWAESFAYYIFVRDLGFTLQMYTIGGGFDLTGHFNSPLMESKRAFIEKFLAGKVLYPGEAPSAPAARRIFIDR